MKVHLLALLSLGLLSVAGARSLSVSLDRLDIASLETDPFGKRRVAVFVIRGDRSDAANFLHTYYLGNGNEVGGERCQNGVYLTEGGARAPGSADEPPRSLLCRNPDDRYGVLLEIPKATTVLTQSVPKIDLGDLTPGQPATLILAESRKISDRGADYAGFGGTFMTTREKTVLQELDTSAWPKDDSTVSVTVPAGTDFGKLPPYTPRIEWPARALNGTEAVLEHPNGGPVLNALELSGIAEQCNGHLALPDTLLDRTVTALGEAAFYGAAPITSVRLPAGLTSIGADAFYGCTGLAEAALPDTLTHIGDSAFAHCTSLKRIRLPKGIADLAPGTFYGCTALTAAELPEGLRSIGTGAFENCSSLQEIVLPASVERIDPRAFRGCPKTLKVTVRNPDAAVDARAFPEGASAVLSRDALHALLNRPENDGTWNGLTPVHGPGTAAVAVRAVGNGTVTGTGAYDTGTAVTLNAAPGTGSTFVGWIGADTPAANPLTFPAPDRDLTLTALFLPEREAGALRRAAIEADRAAGELFLKEDIRAMDFDTPMIEVTDAGVTVGISLQTAETPDAWQPLVPADVSTENGFLKATFPRDPHAGRFYRFGVAPQRPL